MSKKKKKQLLVPMTRSEKIKAWLRRIDWSFLLLELVIIAAAVISSGEPYELNKADSTGFLVWFLLFIGYLPLELFGIFACCFGVDPETVAGMLHGREILALGFCDAGVIAVVWAVMKFWMRPKFGQEYFRNTMIFLRILLFWGLFQFFCYGAVRIWEAGRLNPLHQHLHSHSPGKTAGK